MDVLCPAVVYNVLASDPYFCVAAVYFVSVATVAALVGQHLVRKMISILGRASLIIFILAFTIFVSAISLGKYHTFVIFMAS